LENCVNDSKSIEYTFFGKTEFNMDYGMPFRNEFMQQDYLVRNTRAILSGNYDNK
jgi:hypothetical protein